METSRFFLLLCKLDLLTYPRSLKPTFSSSVPQESTFVKMSPLPKIKITNKIQRCRCIFLRFHSATEVQGRQLLLQNSFCSLMITCGCGQGGYLVISFNGPNRPRCVNILLKENNLYYKVFSITNAQCLKIIQKNLILQEREQSELITIVFVISYETACARKCEIICSLRAYLRARGSYISFV